MPGNVFRLAGIQPSSDTKELFEALVREAEEGELVGAIVISMYRRSRRGRKTQKQFYLTMAGWAANNPAFAAGAMSACLALVNELALQEAGLVP